LHATQPLLPLDLVEATFLVENIQAGMTTSDLLALQMRQLQKHPDNVARVLKKARIISKLQFEQRFIKRLFRDRYKKGELVLVCNMAIELSHNRKSLPCYLGPFQVDERSSEKSYILRDLDRSLQKKRMAAYRLLPYISHRHKFMQDHHIQLDQNSGTDPDESQSTDGSSYSD
jgi:hypothetical protein